MQVLDIDIDIYTVPLPLDAFFKIYEIKFFTCSEYASQTRVHYYYLFICFQAGRGYMEKVSDGLFSTRKCIWERDHKKVRRVFDNLLSIKARTSFYICISNGASSSSSSSSSPLRDLFAASKYFLSRPRIFRFLPHTKLS